MLAASSGYLGAGFRLGFRLCLASLGVGEPSVSLAAFGRLVMSTLRCQVLLCWEGYVRSS